MKRTETEKQIWKAKMQKIAKKIKGMDEAELKQFCASSPVFTCEGHILSLRNQAMLLMQAAFSGVSISQVGGFKQWQRIGRRVMKGQHSVGSIMVPCGKKKDDEDDIFFRYVPVFDVLQTEEIASEESQAA